MWFYAFEYFVTGFQTKDQSQKSETQSETFPSRLLLVDGKNKQLYKMVFQQQNEM